MRKWPFCVCVCACAWLACGVWCGVCVCVCVCCVCVCVCVSWVWMASAVGTVVASLRHSHFQLHHSLQLLGLPHGWSPLVFSSLMARGNGMTLVPWWSGRNNNSRSINHHHRLEKVVNMC